MNSCGRGVLPWRGSRDSPDHHNFIFLETQENNNQDKCKEAYINLDIIRCAVNMEEKKEEKNEVQRGRSKHLHTTKQLAVF